MPPRHATQQSAGRGPRTGGAGLSSITPPAAGDESRRRAPRLRLHAPGADRPSRPTTPAGPHRKLADRCSRGCETGSRRAVRRAAWAPIRDSPPATLHRRPSDGEPVALQSPAQGRSEPFARPGQGRRVLGCGMSAYVDARAEYATIRAQLGTALVICGQLSEAVDTCSRMPTYVEGASMLRVIAIANAKGGTAKTTSAVGARRRGGPSGIPHAAARSRRSGQRDRAAHRRRGERRRTELLPGRHRRRRAHVPPDVDTLSLPGPGRPAHPGPRRRTQPARPRSGPRGPRRGLPGDAHGDPRQLQGLRLRLHRHPALGPVGHPARLRVRRRHPRPAADQDRPQLDRRRQQRAHPARSSSPAAARRWGTRSASCSSTSTPPPPASPLAPSPTSSTSAPSSSRSRPIVSHRSGPVAYAREERMTPRQFHAAAADADRRRFDALRSGRRRGQPAVERVQRPEAGRWTTAPSSTSSWAGSTASAVSP